MELTSVEKAIDALYVKGCPHTETADIFKSLLAERDTLKALCVAYKSALERIAAYEDTSAWKQQRAHNCYKHFDEPVSVKIAHEALATPPPCGSEGK